MRTRNNQLQFHKTKPSLVYHGFFNFFLEKFQAPYGETEMPRKKSIKDIAADMMGLDTVDDAAANDDSPSAPSPPPERKEVTPTILIDGQAVARNTIKRDPLQLKARLYTQIGELLHQLEGATDEPITVRERIAALVAIGRLQELLIEKGKDDDDNAGSAIRKYESAFKNGARRRTKITRSPAGDKLELESDSGDGDGSDPDAITDSAADDLDAAE